MKKALFLALLFLTGVTLAFSQAYDDGHVRYQPVRLSAAEKQSLAESLESLHRKYDPAERMITRKINGYQYHTDAVSGTFHEVRGSSFYAVGLLDSGDPKYEQRAFDILRKVISLQDTIKANKTYGIWPYYIEEPLATKKSPADWNWADFNGVALLDAYMGHRDKLPADLQALIRQSLIRAAESIQKRDVQPGYTNIAIMGTYVTFMTSYLFDLPEMQDYAQKRLQHFYDYTLERGYTEYNSPTYTIVALDELDRMKRHIVDKEAKPKIDYLYDLAWEMVARHYHQPTGQWAGPHSRSYGSLVRPTFYGILEEASDGKIKLLGAEQRADVKVKHKIPERLLPYFLAPKYPRIERDTFQIDDPRVIGTTYMTDQYALSSANRASLSKPRRPFMVYWGTPETPHYLQARLLHDEYDFSSASFYSDQKENQVLAAIGFLTNGGDKHMTIDRLKEGRFAARDLRLRFEFGNVDVNELSLPKSPNAPFVVNLDGLQFNLQLYFAAFDGLEGHWEKGSDDQTAWLDYVLYAGETKAFDMNALSRAVLGFTFALAEGEEKIKTEQPMVSTKNGKISAKWKGLVVEAPLKPTPQPKNL